LEDLILPKYKPIVYGLSDREVEVLQEVSTGAKNKTIAHTLDVKEKTIKFHLVRIYKKLRVGNRAECIILIFTDPILRKMILKL